MNENLIQFVKVLLVKLSDMLDSSNFVRFFHCQSFALYPIWQNFRVGKLLQLMYRIDIRGKTFVVRVLLLLVQQQELESL